MTRREIAPVPQGSQEAQGRTALELLTRWNTFALAAEMLFADPAVVEAWMEFHLSLSSEELGRLAKAQAEQAERLARL
jgi:hypothetical protein